jgi:hypothetical protein
MKTHSMIVICTKCYDVDTHEIFSGSRTSSKWCRRCRAAVLPLGEMIEDIYKKLHARYEEEQPS